MIHHHHQPEFKLLSTPAVSIQHDSTVGNGGDALYLSETQNTPITFCVVGDTSAINPELHIYEEDEVSSAAAAHEKDY